ncbi:23574_t:CDS:1, partial [Gigaspora rosea]
EGISNALKTRTKNEQINSHFPNSQDALTDQNEQQQIELHIPKFQQAFIILG